MDQQSFDRLARILGEATDRREGLKRALAAVLGGSAAVAALEERAEAKRKGRGPDAGKKKRKKCKPACTGGYVCEKVGRKRECVCPSGVTCGTACCAAGQSCEDGVCADSPEPVTCLAFGEACKDVGRRCCDGLSCASGQDGSFPVACYRSKGAACQSTAECPFGMSCTQGRCTAIEWPDDGQDGDGGGGGGGGTVPAGGSCTATSTCAAGTTCRAYDTPITSAPGGTFCSKDLLRTCEGDPECTCYSCWYTRPGVTPTAADGRQPRGSANVKACCLPPSAACTIDNDCCLGLTCNTSTKLCTGSLKIPLGAPCDANSGPSCVSGACTGGICQLRVGDLCDAAAAESYCPTGSTCRKYDGSTSAFSFCLLAIGDACSVNTQCANQKCSATSGSATKICTECITDPACEVLYANTTLADCKRWSCEAGLCKQVAATNRPCTQTGGAAGFCQTDATCGATTATCDVTAGNVAALATALADAPYKSAISIGGTFTLSSMFELDKFGCNDNVNLDDTTSCPYNTTPTRRVSWDVTLVPCSGQTAVLDGNDSTRIFELTNYSMTIKGMTLRKGSGDFGGAIRSSEGPYLVATSLTLDDVTATGNTATLSGGAVHTNLIKSFTVKSSTFTGNKAKGDGGAVYSKLGSSGAMSVHGVTMTGNTANDGSATPGQCTGGRTCAGAGIRVETDGGTLTCLGTNVINNSPPLPAIGDCADAYASNPAFWNNCGCATLSAT